MKTAKPRRSRAGALVFVRLSSARQAGSDAAGAPELRVAGPLARRRAGRRPVAPRAAASASASRVAERPAPHVAERPAPRVAEQPGRRVAGPPGLRAVAQLARPGRRRAAVVVAEARVAVAFAAAERRAVVAAIAAAEWRAAVAAIAAARPAGALARRRARRRPAVGRLAERHSAAPRRAAGPARPGAVQVAPAAGLSSRAASRPAARHWARRLAA